MDGRCISQNELAQRWQVREATLERWRSHRKGPQFLRLGGQVRYRLVDVESYELEKMEVVADSQQQPLGIDSQPEFDYASDKRADIRVSYRNSITVPIEIKSEWHSELWTAVQSQLIPQYTKQKETEGFGIYLVLCVGGTEQSPARDGGKRPLTSTELELRLHR